jgi:hypothetical protein
VATVADLDSSDERDEEERPSTPLPRLLGAGFVLSILLAVAAVAARGHESPAGGSDAHNRAVSQVLFDIVFTIALLAMLAMFIAFAWVRASTSGPRTASFRSVFVIAGFVALFCVVIVLAGPRLADRRDEIARPVGGGVPSAVDRLREERRRVDEPEFAWPLAAGIGALVLVAIGYAAARRMRAHRAFLADVALAEELASILDETLDDLRREPDARKAVIAAYARMERALGAHGLPRARAEAPLEYLSRILLELSVTESSVRRLTELFEHAKFSHHPIEAEMKDEAIDALVALRDDLRALTIVDEPPPLPAVPEGHGVPR